MKCGMARCVARARRAGHRWGDAWNVGDKESGDKEKCPKRTTIPSKLAQREREKEREIERGRCNVVLAGNRKCPSGSFVKLPSVTLRL